MKNMKTRWKFQQFVYPLDICGNILIKHVDIPRESFESARKNLKNCTTLLTTTTAAAAGPKRQLIRIAAGSDFMDIQG